MHDFMVKVRKKKLQDILKLVPLVHKYDSPHEKEEETDDEMGHEQRQAAVQSASCGCGNPNEQLHGS